MEKIVSQRSEQEQWKAHTPSASDWRTVLIEAFSSPQTLDTTRVVSQEMIDSHPLGPCLQTISPLLQYGLTALQSRVQALQQRYAFLPLDSQEICSSSLQNIIPELLFQLSKPMILEMHVARIQGRLQGETAQERFTDFVRQLTQKDMMLALFTEYPVLARLLLSTIDHWIDSTEEILASLCADWLLIRALFTPESDPGPLVEMQGRAGDVHRRGRSVHILRFRSGLRLLYKPKPLAVDRHFQELLIWLNEHGARPAFRVLKVLDRGDYGWSEFVAARPCTSQDEVVRFYERQGSYLALLYAVNATDFHIENVIACGEYPMLVDLEALFHPDIDGDDLEDPADIAIGQSVLYAGLLPQWLWSDEQSPGIDTSGLGGLPGQTVPQAVSRWREAQTDRMHLIRQNMTMPPSQNRPRLNGEDVDVVEYIHCICTGFKHMYHLLMDSRDQLFAEQLARFAHDEIRVLMRPTQIYGSLLEESFHPDLLRAELEREHFFDYLQRAVKQRPYFSRLIAAERQDLLGGDIPLFTSFPDSHTLFTSDREPLLDFFATPSLELVQQRIQRLNEHDLARQLWVIEASLATLKMETGDQISKDLSINPIAQTVNNEQMMAKAKAVGRRLEELALLNDDGAYWLGVNAVRENIWRLLPVDFDLYDGAGGIALFLAYLGSITEEPCFTILAKKAFAAICARIELRKAYADTSIGAFAGWGSFIYLLTHLSKLWNDPELIHKAEELLEMLPGLIARDEQLDIIGGSAGCLLSLLSLYAIYPSARVLEVAIQCGDHLLAAAQAMPAGTGWKTPNQQRPLGGFSHGSAGIGLSLLKLAAVSGEERFRQTARAAFAYDSSLFVPSQQNWADLRVFPARATEPAAPDEQRQECMVAWCHGAAGIGLARLEALALLDDVRMRDEIDIALNTTMEQGLAGNHSLCHGTSGNIETLLTAARLLNRSEDRARLERAIAIVMSSLEAHGWVTGVPLGVETPGLMTGLAGIGYELLRLAEPDRVPAVLLVAPPII